MVSSFILTDIFRSFLFVLGFCRIQSPEKGRQTVHQLKDEPLSQKCADCKGIFTAIIRKHHCKQCGDIFCAKCSSTFATSGAPKERSCIKCASKGLLLRRKAKPSKKSTHSIVIKSMKPEKLDHWDVTTTENTAPINIVQKVEKVHDIKLENKAMQHIPHSTNNDIDDITTKTEEEQVTLLKTSKPTLDDDEDDRIPNQGVLCVIPPSLYNFMFGNE